MASQNDQQDNHDEADVERILRKTTTKDGSGFESEDELPESDFDSFAEDGVENDHDGHNVVSSEEDTQ
jgi:hypothetical protein